MELVTYAIVVLGIALGMSLIIVAVSAVAVNAGKSKSRVVRGMRGAARHLNGDAAPPPGLVTFFEELPIPHSTASAPERHS